MGVYLNPGNQAFAEIVESDYVDKTGLVGLVNDTIGTNRKLTCISRPRRFGKSYAAQMLCAYYDKTCDSRALFEGLEIAGSASFEKHLNSYDVIYLDMTNILGKVDPQDLVEYVQSALIEEIRVSYPRICEGGRLDEILVRVAERTGNKFIALIDEWDAPIRETPQIEGDYLRFLRMLFKSSATTARMFAAAYMTGILPIKKDGSQSAISDFREFTMIKPRQFGKYVGFTEAEVKNLCEQHEASFESMKHWYDGYDFRGVGPVYNPNSVMKALEFDDFDSYWTQSSAAEGLMSYISKPYSGLAKTVAELVGGVSVKVDTNGFANDLVTFRGINDVLTLMIHLGYLAYDSQKETARIPNEEIRREFQRAIHSVDHSETRRRLEDSERLFLDTIRQDEGAVAAQIQKVHEEETSPLHYNKEDSLRSVVKLAYYTYRDHYLQWEELPAGVGFADVVYLPKRDSDWPALVVELKWDMDAQGAIDQIRQRRYPDALKGYGGQILLVGVSYDKESKVHTCKIEQVE